MIQTIIFATLVSYAAPVDADSSKGFNGQAELRPRNYGPGGGPAPTVAQPTLSSLRLCSFRAPEGDLCRIQAQAQGVS